MSEARNERNELIPPSGSTPVCATCGLSEDGHDALHGEKNSILKGDLIVDPDYNYKLQCQIARDCVVDGCSSDWKIQKDYFRDPHSFLPASNGHLESGCLGKSLHNLEKF